MHLLYYGAYCSADCFTLGSFVMDGCVSAFVQAVSIHCGALFTKVLVVNFLFYVAHIYPMVMDLKKFWPNVTPERVLHVDVLIFSCSYSHPCSLVKVQRLQYLKVFLDII